MLDDLKDKLNSNLAKLKQLLPEKFRGESDDEYEDDDENEDVTEDEVTADHEIDKEALSEESQEEDDEEADEDDEEEDSEEQAAKNRKQLLVRLLIVAIGGYVALDMFVLNPDQGGEEVQVMNRPKPRRVRKKVQKPVEKPKKEAQVQNENPFAEQEKVVEKAPEVQEAPVENEPVETAEQENMPVEENSPVQEVARPQEQQEVEEVTQEEAVVESPVVENDINQSETSGENIVDDLTSDDLENKLNQITEKLEKAEKKAPFIEAPSYEQYGKGLVYNCKEKHWACVDRTPYLQCRQHQEWSSENRKAPNCVTEKVYSSFKDCRIVQVHYINTVQTPEGCK